MNGEQREWILKRDGNQCQFSGCKETANLQIHHITPVSWCYEVQKQTTDEVNSPKNLITLCELHHQEFVHPHYGIIAKELYSHNPKIYEEIGKWHQTFREAKFPYWNTTWDDIFRMTAIKKTQDYLSKHPNNPYPT